MSDKVEAISQSKEIQQAIKQEHIREQQEEKKVPAKEDAKPAAASAKAVDKKASEKKSKAKETADKAESKPSKKVVLERVYVVPLVKAYAKTRSHRARIAISLLRQFVAKHVKAKEPKKIYIDGAVNSAVLARGSRKPPKKVKVLVRKDEEGKVFVSFPAAK